MATTKQEIRVLKEDIPLRERLLHDIDRYLDLPVALASIVMVLLAIIQLTGRVAPGWEVRLSVLQGLLWLLFVLQFTVQLILAPKRRVYVRRHWLNALMVVLPFLGFLRILAILRLANTVPVVPLLVFGSESLSAPFALLKRRKLGRLMLVTALVILLGSALVYLAEVGTPHASISNFGDALWWSATTVTTVGSSLDVVTPFGRVLGFLLQIYGLGFFSYLTASIASVLIGLDQGRPPAPNQAKADVNLTPSELATLRSIVDRARQ